MFVATYVAIEMPPADTCSTKWNVLPSGVRAALVWKSLTDVMVAGPVQTNVATIASPMCGLVGLNPFAMVPTFCSFNVPMSLSGTMPVAAAVTVTECETELVAPWLSVTVNVTVCVPAATYVCDGFWTVEVPPSPKVQL